MKALYLKKVFSFVTLLTSSVGLAGGWSGNGGSSALDKDNIWFLGEEPIPYCLIASKGILSPPALHMMIKKNSERWAQFFQRYGMDQEKLGLVSGGRRFPDEMERKISIEFVQTAHCEDVVQYCSPQRTDPEKCHLALRDKVLFLIGEPNSVVLDYMKMNGPAEGAAIRTDYNHATYRSGGIVWVKKRAAQNWSHYAHFLLHEMGHVLGMVHDSCWVMSKNISQILGGGFTVGELEKIESINWPYSVQDGDMLYFTDQKATFTTEENRGYYPNSFLSTFGVLDILKYNKDDYFRVYSQVRKSSGAGVQIEIVIEELSTKKQHVLSGDLRNSFFGHYGEAPFAPRLYTEWKNSNGSTSFGTEYLRGGSVPVDLQGILDWDGQKVAVHLSRTRGLTLNLYFPEAKNWFTLQTVFGGYFP